MTSPTTAAAIIAQLKAELETARATERTAARAAYQARTQPHTSNQERDRLTLAFSDALRREESIQRAIAAAKRAALV